MPPWAGWGLTWSEREVKFGLVSRPSQTVSSTSDTPRQSTSTSDTPRLMTVSLSWGKFMPFFERTPTRLPTNLFLFKVRWYEPWERRGEVLHGHQGHGGVAWIQALQDHALLRQLPAALRVGKAPYKQRTGLRLSSGIARQTSTILNSFMGFSNNALFSRTSLT